MALGKLGLMRVAASPKGVVLEWGEIRHEVGPDQADNLAILLIRASDRARYMALHERGRDIKIRRP